MSVISHFVTHAFVFSPQNTDHKLFTPQCFYSIQFKSQVSSMWVWRRRWKREKLTDRRTDGRRTKASRKTHMNFQLRWAKSHCLPLPITKETTTCTRHCCNSMQWWWQINCMFIIRSAVMYTPFHVSLIKYKDCFGIWWMIKETITRRRNTKKGSFGGLNVMVMLGSIKHTRQFDCQIIFINIYMKTIYMQLMRHCYTSMQWWQQFKSANFIVWCIVSDNNIHLWQPSCLC